METEDLRRDGVQGPAALHGKSPELESFCKYRPSGWSLSVLFPHQEHHERAAKEQERWQNECQPVSYVLLGIYHANLADQSADIDHEIEVHVYTRYRHSWIDNGPLAILLGFDVLAGMLRLVLFGNERGDVGFEAANPDTEYDKADRESSDGAIRVGDD